MSGPALVILAAGESQRLGTCKALVALREAAPATPLDLLLEAGRVLGDPEPLVVTGADHPLIAAHLGRRPGAVALENPGWQAGRTGSVARAVGTRPGRDLCLAPVDVPLVPAAVFLALAAAWAKAGAPARGWLAPRVPDGTHADEWRHGHPLIVGRELVAEIARWAPDRPLREGRGHADPLLAVEVAAAEILDDLDDLEDLAALRERLR